jgi:hypothetical protein
MQQISIDWSTMSNPFLDRTAKGDHGNTSEKRVGKSLGARMTPASGALRGAKSDGVKGKFRLEMKSTVKDRISVEKEWLVKITHEALAHNQIPVVILSFVNGDGSPAMTKNAEWGLVPMHVLKEIVE